MATKHGLQWRFGRLQRYVPRIIIDAGKGVEDSVLLAGGGRTGTTWAANILNWRNDYRLMYEPFNSGHVGATASFTQHLYLRAGNDDPRYVEPARRVFTGRIRNWFVDEHNRVFYARKRLVKDVNILPALPWVHERFSQMPIVVLISHPFATAVSRMQMGWPGDTSVFLDQPDLIEDQLGPFVDEMRNERDDFMRQLTFWCVDYSVCLRRLRRTDVHIIYYERLSALSEIELRGLCAFLGREWDPRMIDAIVVPSIQAKRSRRAEPSAVVSGGDVLSGWRRHVTPQRSKRGRDLLRRFGLDEIYGDGDMPNPEVTLAIMRP